MADKTIPDFIFPPGKEKPDMNRDELAAVAETVAALSPENRELLAAVQESPYRLTTAEQFMEFEKNTDCFVLESRIRNLEDLGWEYLSERMTIELTNDLKAAIDPVPFGKRAVEDDRGCFTGSGYLMPTGDEWQHDRREPEKKPSIRERLEQSKKECVGKDKAQPARDKSVPEL